MGRIDIEALKEEARRRSELDIRKENLRRQANIEAPKVEMTFASEADEPTEDDMLEVFEQARKGELQLTVPYGEAVHDLSNEPTDDEIFQSYEEQLDGKANRRRSIENARLEQREREEEMVEYLKHTGNPLPTHMEHLRPRLKEYGY